MPYFTLTNFFTSYLKVTEGARLHFIKFETKHIETTLDYIQQSLLEANLDIKEVKVNSDLVVRLNVYK